MLVNEIFHAALTKGNPYVKQELTNFVIHPFTVPATFETTTATYDRGYHRSRSAYMQSSLS